jgi:hypothetical protein
MKSQRRHDLKTNALARGIEGLPSYWRDYGNKVLLFIIVCLVVFLAVRYWRDKRAREAQLVAESLHNAQTAIQQLDRLPGEYGSAVMGHSAAVATQRKLLIQNADSAINSVINDAKDPPAIVNGYLYKGELNWQLANMPPIPGAQTQPSLRLEKSPDEFLAAAKSAYEQVLSPQLRADPLAIFQARVALAAIAENQHQWDEARKQYQAVLDAPGFPQSFKQYASDRLAALPQLESPAVLGEEGPSPFATPPTAAPATSPSSAPAMGPFPIPSTQPATRPSAPASQPTT